MNSKKDWSKNADADQNKKFAEEVKAVQEKLTQENMKLRDESYYLKGQQDKALRLQQTHLLIEEKNCIEVLDALNELQNGLFEQDQTSVTPQIKMKDVVVLNTKDSEINEQKNKKIKQAQSEIILLNASLDEVNKTLLLLKTEGISTSDTRTTLEPIPYFHNKSILLYLGCSALLLLLFTGLVFGASNKVSSAKVVSDFLGAPFLGTIPNLPNEGLENAKHKKLTDAIDQITENLFKSMSAKDIKILNVLSPETNEGRTQLAGMLSLSFNLKKNMKVIALDTCFNNPKLADFLELKTKNQSNEEGLIAYIKNLIETKEISESDNNQWLAKLVKPCIKNGIFVISPGSGSLTDNYSFNSKVISTMYEGLGKYVDLIISDTPPLNSSLSFVSKVLAENSNGNILLIKKGVYKKSDLENIKKKLMGVQILGVILK
jgi:Mrp family chromosome partitioning ATPase